MPGDGAARIVGGQPGTAQPDGPGLALLSRVWRCSRRDCPTARADYNAWLEQALDLAGSLIGLQDSTRQIRKTGAGADKLRTWDAVRASNGADGIAELTDLLGRCGRRVGESDAAFRPPSREELFRRAAERIGEKKKSELASFGIPLEEKDEFKAEGVPPRSIR